MENTVPIKRFTTPTGATAWLDFRYAEPRGTAKRAAIDANIRVVLDRINRALAEAQDSASEAAE